VELYFNDCNDLLNEKAKIPIAGLGAKTTVKKSYHTGGVEAQFDEKGKWIAPTFNDDKSAKKKSGDSYSAQGAKEIELNTF
jgi:hypothetical protein